jgi:putative component of membrane protein insertase Oxa1/YidC/SpoIIIJ protein YidD
MNTLDMTYCEVAIGKATAFEACIMQFQLVLKCGPIFAPQLPVDV